MGICKCTHTITCDWNLAAFFVLPVAASAGGVLPAAFMPDINPQNPTSPTCALTLTSSWAFQTTLASLPLPRYQLLKFPSLLFMWKSILVPVIWCTHWPACGLTGERDAFLVLYLVWSREETVLLGCRK